jgi:GxxExxY protein
MELAEVGLHFERERPLPVFYRGQPAGLGYRIDLLVEERVIVEVKAVQGLEAVHGAQLLSYLRLSGHQIGLLFNFNVKWLVKDGLRRVVNERPRRTP